MHLRGSWNAQKYVVILRPILNCTCSFKQYDCVSLGMCDRALICVQSLFFFWPQLFYFATDDYFLRDTDHGNSYSSSNDLLIICSVELFV